ncbi:hypothetical protein SAMN02745150_00419 [Brevinema andersonii]|uniref:Uncharacterized protein n=1 Tax=Brevinema andersonii TaxID=34097 RepID=A0A1I1DAI5_BREAD|nr:hypothetical protein [Brevinema andersonii]SFB71346.1 hypothetical protein SAMN02745150_00419 [Brevinema andersonii]
MKHSFSHLLFGAALMLTYFGSNDKVIIPVSSIRVINTTTVLTGPAKSSRVTQIIFNSGTSSIKVQESLEEIYEMINK